MTPLTSRGLRAPILAHGFFTRAGGVSTGIYESLNCGSGSRDDGQAVHENRARVAHALGQEIELVTQSQIHSAIVHEIADVPGPPRDGDGMVTTRPGVALGILTADCAPVLLADARAKVIGAAHAGWRGAFGGVLENTIAAMEQLGAARAHIHAAIGPAISQANYEVDSAFRDRFAVQDADNAAFFVSGRDATHFQFDLKAYAAERLRKAGVGAVDILPACTYPRENGFFSFRRASHLGQPDYGRQISAITLLPQGK
jgi:YfiH family protein